MMCNYNLRNDNVKKVSCGGELKMCSSFELCKCFDAIAQLLNLQLFILWSSGCVLVQHNGALSKATAT